MINCTEFDEDQKNIRYHQLSVLTAAPPFIGFQCFKYFKNVESMFLLHLFSKAFSIKQLRQTDVDKLCLFENTAAIEPSKEWKDVSESSLRI